MQVHRSLAGLLMVAAVAATGCNGRLAYNLPPAERLMHPGPGVGGPGPGVIPPAGGMMMDPSVGQAGFGGQGGFPGGNCNGGDCYGGGGAFGNGYAMQAGFVGAGSFSQIAFLGEAGLQIGWDVSGQGYFDSVPLITPGRQDFPQGAIYRLKISNLPGRPEAELFPTLEIAPVTPRTDAYLAHSPVPVQFSQEDFDQVLSGNFVTKVIYLPDPEFQELALAGVETLVSTRLDPGVDPIAEADRRGSILAIVRMGNRILSSVGTSPYEPEQVMQASNNLPMPYGPQQGPQYGGQGQMQQAQYGIDQSGMPMGMQTSGFAPPAVPPHIMAAAPQWGMPMSGTPIGLPGPPHIPLGSPAGLRKHVMKNRTRMYMPPPVAKERISVKQRPGMNYPDPVNHVHIDETNRQPLRLLQGLFW